MNKLYLIILFSVFSLSLFAQGRQISGKVTDAQGSGLPGVTILVKGTTTGTVTDIDGNYRLNAGGDVLVFSFIGFVKQEIIIGNQSVINVVLLEDTKMLDELVVIGYGAQKKKDLTTAVSIVGEKEIKDRPIVSAAQALQGKAAGVQVVQPSGKPGIGMTVRVRGATSVLAGNEPLYVVDGVMTESIAGINPQDIATMSVLKDASSTAIYGARAANGVVIITTKSGVADKPVVSFNTFFGFTKIRKTIDVLNTKQYRDLMEEIGQQLDPSWTQFNDWSDLTFGTGQQQSYQLSVSGGDKNSKYYVSGAYLNDVGLVKPAQFKRYSLRINLDEDVRSWLKIGTNINILNSNTKDSPDNLSSGRGGVILSALNTPPFLSVYNDDGSGSFTPNPFQPSWENPVAYMEGPDQLSIDNRLLGSVTAEVKIIKGLTYKTRFGADITSHIWDYYLDPKRTNYGRNNNGIGRSDKSTGSILLYENTLDYAKVVGKHNFTGLLGSSIEKYTGRGSYLEGTDFPEDVNVRSLNAANIITGSTWKQEWAYASFFGRILYNFDSRIYLTMTVRRDGSSKLANPWGTMPSFSAGYRLTSLGFMKSMTFINDLKLRGGWGVNGNSNGIPNYAKYGLVSYYRRPQTDPLSGPGFSQTVYGNPDLKWETTKQTNIGFDLSMFDSRINLALDIYYKKTSDVLQNVQLPNTLPITTIQTNDSKIINKGIEFNLNTVNLDHQKFKWTSDLNMSFNKNEVTSMKYTKTHSFGSIYSNNQDATTVKIGYSLGSFYGYVSDGVDPETGDIIYRDVNNNGIDDPGDRTLIGCGMPDFTFGFTNNLNYGRFNLSIFIQGSYGNEIFNATRIDLEGMFDSKNQSVDVLRRWTPENPYTDIPRVSEIGNTDNVRVSSRFIEDGSYVRLKSLTLSYEVIKNSQKLKFLKNASVYVTGQNLITLTGYSGFDPEVSAYGNSATEVGVDYGTYPQSISVIFGVNVQF